MRTSAPNAEIGTVAKRLPPTRRKNTETREREHLTKEEVRRMISAARKTGRYGNRDAALILIAVRHGLRVSEICDLTWERINFASRQLHVTRSKGGETGTHWLERDELIALRELRNDTGESAFVFNGERGPLQERAVHKIVARAGIRGGIPFPVHPHMLRHSAGFALANANQSTRAIQQYLGHKDIRSTERYTHLNGEYCKNFGRLVL